MNNGPLHWQIRGGQWGEQCGDKVKNLYDSVSKEYAEAFSNELEKKPKDREMLRRFSQEIGRRSPVWDFGCGYGHTTKYLNNLGIKSSGLDLSEKMLDQARRKHPDIHFRKGNILEIDTIEREPYPEIECQSRRAYLFATKPAN